MSKQVRADKQLIIAAMGMASAAITGGILGLIDASTGFALYSLILFFIVPVGAFVAGIAAASGYYFGSTLFHQKPAGGVAINMVLVTIGAYLIAHYIPYNSLVVEGISIKDRISFFQYLDLSIRHTTLSIKGHATGELGAVFGYLYAAIQLIGFAFGGFCVFACLLGLPFCERCSRYLKKITTVDRYTSEGEQLSEQNENFVKMLEEKEYMKALEFHAASMGADTAAGHHLRTRVTMHKCKDCRVNHLEFEVAHLENGNWQDISKSNIKLWIEPEARAVS
jgi:hypothetical protein